MQPKEIQPKGGTFQVQEYKRLQASKHTRDHQEAHQIRRSAFSAYVFQLIGNKDVLLKCIQHPICSAAQPAEAIRQFIDAWAHNKKRERESSSESSQASSRSKRRRV